MNKADTTIAGRIKMNSIEWCVPRFTPSILNQADLCKKKLNKTPTVLQYVEGSVLTKEVKLKIYGLLN